ncbi:MAG: hypothetical protein H6810_02505 [Phycisphaeraceae bacterium]|nr:MAG: hypothetical protein H6810_02505 [Phycisphaeraceae bacterium]
MQTGVVRNVYVTDCTLEGHLGVAHIKTNERRGGFIENVWVTNIKGGSARSLLVLNTDVLYQWRDLVETVERRLTPIKGIHLQNITLGSVEQMLDIQIAQPEMVEGLTLDGIEVMRPQSK